jgi:hypothetical protein
MDEQDDYDDPELPASGLPSLRRLAIFMLAIVLVPLAIFALFFFVVYSHRQY